MYPDEGQTAAQAPAGYITLFWDYFTDGNFRLPVTRFILDVLGYYKFHISQLHPMGMVRILQFEFLYRSMHIEPTVNHFRVFYQLHCSQGFYSFSQHPSAKKILLTPPKSFHEWKPKFFYIKAGVIPMKMTFRGAEDIEVETLKTQESEIWYQDMKDVPSIELPERALVAAEMSLHWKMDRQDKLVYMEDDKKHGKMPTVKKGANEEPWYYQIVRNFALPRDVDLSAQPSSNVGELTNLGIAPESRKKKRALAVAVAPKKPDTQKADVLREEKKKGTCLVYDPWCDYVVVSDTLEGLAPVAVRKPKVEPRDTSDIPASNPDDPIDLESSPEPLVRAKAVKRKLESEAAAQPAKKITRKRISKKGNLDALDAKLSPEKPIPSVRVESSSVFNDDLPSSPPRASIKEQLEGTKAAEVEVEKVVEVEKPVEVELEAEKVVETETADVGATKPKSPEVVAHEPERGKSIQEDPMITVPSSATTSSRPIDDFEESPANVDHGFIAHDEEDSPIRPEETLGDYYYRSYSERGASEIHAPWSAAGWERKAEAEAALLAEARKCWKEICEKDNNEKRALRTDVTNLKAKIEKLKKEKAEAKAARDEARSHRERNEQREVQTCTILALRNKEIEELTTLLSDKEQTKAELESAQKELQLERVEKAETSRRLTETEEKLENSETAWVTAESLVEPLENDMLWMRHHGVINVANSILNSIDLDQTVANLMVTARSDRYNQGYAECTQHVNDALKVDLDNNRSAMRGVDTEAAHATAKIECNNLCLPVMDLVTAALQSDDFVAKLKDILPDEVDDDEDLE
ncbi:hypothetical protein HanPI659440_Chr13g0491171 [Helianthus annuus]|nr:hypothetical protein HanPI659440_Chr13g0491171 [Helianthus annuus]